MALGNYHQKIAIAPRNLRDKAAQRQGLPCGNLSQSVDFRVCTADRLQRIVPLMSPGLSLRRSPKVMVQSRWNSLMLSFDRYGRKGSRLPQLQFQTVLETFTSYGSWCRYPSLSLGTGLRNPALWFQLWELLIQHVVFKLALVILLLLVAVSISTPWLVGIS